MTTLYPPCESNALVRGTGGVASLTFGCLCADPCTHSVQGLNWLPCFCNFWNRRIRRFHFEVVHEAHIFFGDLRLGDGVGCCPATPSCPLEVEIGESPNEWYLHDAIVSPCVFSRRAHLVKATGGVVSVKFWKFSIAPAGGYSDLIAVSPPPPSSPTEMGGQPEEVRTPGGTNRHTTQPLWTPPPPKGPALVQSYHFPALGSS